MFGRLSVVVLGTWVLVVSLLMPSAEGKRRRSMPMPALTILEVEASPSPFEIGKGELALSVVVQLPRRLNGANLLEITALISSPSKHSMRFLSQRIPLSLESGLQGESRVHTTLIWNGRNQAQELVSPARYRYEVRAKLMAEKGDGPRAKVVSRRSRGTVEVINPATNEPPLGSQEVNQSPDSSDDDNRMAEEAQGPVETAEEPSEEEVEMLPEDPTDLPGSEEVESNEELEEEKTLQEG